MLSASSSHVWDAPFGNSRKADCLSVRITRPQLRAQQSALPTPHLAALCLQGPDHPHDNRSYGFFSDFL